MAKFLFLYLGGALIAALLAFAFSYREAQNHIFKSLLLALYIIVILGVLFLTGVLEVKYGMHRLYSTLIAASVLLVLYLGDTLGKRLRKSE